jgi:alpha-beta hydrolase superfamily lysophospholipase
MIKCRQTAEEFSLKRKWKGDILFLLVVGALIGGWLYLYPHPGDSALSPLTPPRDLQAQDLPSYASFEGLKLAYRLYEPRGEPHHVLVFLHDTLLHGGWYASLGQDLAREGVAVFLPDRRGWGRSAGDHRQVADQASVLIEDITAMLSVAQARYPHAQTRLYLGGHGRGAGLALRYIASQRPVDGVILVSPYISDDQPNLRPEGWQALARGHPGEVFLAQSGLVYWPVWHYGWPKEMLEADPLLETDMSISLMQETVPEDLDAAYRALTMPLLCVQAQEDPLFNPDKTPELMALFAASDRQLETVPGADYLTVIESAANPIAHWLEGR